MKKISVIIPVYNTEKYLKECIESVLSQSYQDLDIIIIDDCSSDNSYEICVEYEKCDKRITLMRNDYNCGVGYSRNKGLLYAKGEYVIFLDSDDIFNKDLISYLYQGILKYDSDICICREKALRSGIIQNIEYLIDKTCLPKDNLINPEFFQKYLFNFCILWAWDKLYKKDFLYKNIIKFPESKKMIASEDLVFVADSFSKAKSIFLIDDFLITHRYHARSLEATRNQITAYEALKELKFRLMLSGLFNKYEQSFINVALMYFSFHKETRKSDYGYVEKLFYTKWMPEFQIDRYPQNFFYDQDLYYKEILGRKKYKIKNNFFVNLFFPKNSIRRSILRYLYHKCRHFIIK